MIGQDATFDVFISYRVKSDSEHALLVYEMLTAAGLKVWLDAKCLEKGVSWEAGFCNGLVSSRIFLPLMSKGGQADFASLTENQAWCDNVLLEYNLALELSKRGLIEYIFPVLIGDYSVVPREECYADYFRSNGRPDLSKSGGVCVTAVIDKMTEHLDRLSLGSMLLPRLTVKEVMDRILICQGHFIKGEKGQAFAALVEAVKDIGTR